ncbi:MAG: sel1 repeat family protein [Prevotella sp.]|nr:sel1 repeat family protein [Prevotella sp.]
MKESKTIYSYLIEHMESPSFKKVRYLACDFVRKLPQELCDELHNSLNRGVDIIDSEALLQMYFYAFGEMHAAKLNYAFEHLQQYIKEAEKVELIDYGCGQGLASICYHDFIKDVNPSQEISRVTLIEPSEMALSRASLLCSKFYPDAEIVTVNKDFENLSENDIELSSSIPTIHLFSNILDVESYKIEKFAQIVKTISSGENEYVIVSPIQNANRMKRLKDFVTTLDNNQYFEQYLDKREFRGDKDWTCAVLICSTKIDKKEVRFDLNDVYETAVSIIEGRDRDKAKCTEVFHMLNIGALTGDMKCQNALGCFYCKGIGTDKDYNKAFKWFEKSANQGFDKALFNLSICYEKGEGTEVNYKKAVELLIKLCDSGFINSYNNLAICYMEGKGVEINEEKAIDLWKYASNQNESSALYNLGYCYLNGIGVEKDMDKGVKFVKAASEQNNVDAYLQLGECYRKGMGVDIDIPLSIQYFTKAGMMDDKESIISLIEIFEEKDYKNMFGDEQFDVFVKAVHLGIPEISKITATWINKEPGGFNDGNVVYGSNGLRIVTTRGKEI